MTSGCWDGCLKILNLFDQLQFRKQKTYRIARNSIIVEKEPWRRRLGLWTLWLRTLIQWQGISSRIWVIFHCSCHTPFMDPLRGIDIYLWQNLNLTESKTTKYLKLVITQSHQHGISNQNSTIESISMEFVISKILYLWIKNTIQFKNHIWKLKMETSDRA